jgi:hypothetical protein
MADNVTMIPFVKNFSLIMLSLVSVYFVMLDKPFPESSRPFFTFHQQSFHILDSLKKPQGRKEEGRMQKEKAPILAAALLWVSEEFRYSAPKAHSQKGGSKPKRRETAQAPRAFSR